MPSRTVDKDDIKFPKGNRNGSLFFGQCILSHDPLDYVLIMLGTNDLKTKFNSNLEDISRSLQEKYIDYLKKDLYPLLNSVPQIIIVAPGEIRGGLFDDFDSSSEEKSKSFNSIYRQLAIKNDCIFIDNQNLIAGEDGVHLNKESHQKLAEKIFSAINKENINK